MPITIHNFLPYVAGFAICLSSASLASAQTKPQAPLSNIDWSKYEVIMYDADTIARINAPAPPPAESVPVVTPPQITTPVAPTSPTPSTTTLTRIAPPVIETPAPAQPAERDLSQFISRRNKKNVPIIDGAPDCAADDLAVRINITRIKKVKGSLVIDLHDDVPEHFLKSSKVLLRIRQPVTATEMSVCMPVAKTRPICHRYLSRQ